MNTQPSWRPCGGHTSDTAGDCRNASSIYWLYCLAIWPLENPKYL